jgi:hypothetical protein
MKKLHLQREMPHNFGIPVDPRELDLPESRLNLDDSRNWNLHHWNYSASKMARFVMSRTLRNLDNFQSPLPKDVHTILHQRYDSTVMPDPTIIMDVLDQARQEQVPLRYGTLHRPEYRSIDDQLWRDINAEYRAIA